MEAVRAVRSWVAAWVVSAVLWVVLTDSVQIEELLAAAGVAVLAATAFELVRRQRVAAQAIDPRLLLRGWRVLIRVPADVWRLTRAAFAQAVQRRTARGVVVAIPFTATGEDAGARGRRAVAIGLGSVAPNTVVIGVDREGGRMLVHQLEPTGDPSDLDPLELR